MPNPFDFTNEEWEIIRDKCSRRAKNHKHYFSRTKRTDKSRFFNNRNKVFFDSETYLYYETPTSEPLVIPYLIGVCDDLDKGKSFRYFLSENATEEFFSYVMGDVGFSKGWENTLSNKYKRKWQKVDNQWKQGEPVRFNTLINLYAFNLSYDFHALRLWLEAKYKKDVYISYTTGTDSKFVTGSLISDPKSPRFNGKGCNVALKDLWMWDRSRGLKKRINDIKDIVWKKDPNDGDKWIKELNYKLDEDNNPIKDEIVDTLHKTIYDYGLDFDSFSKGTLGEDYLKINLHKQKDGYYYWTSKEDWEKGLSPKKLNEAKEIDYLRIDVLSMPVVEKEEWLMRQEAKRILGITKTKATDCTITAPGFAKYLLEEYSGLYLREYWRVPIHRNDYEEMLLNYTGAFTASNPNILLLDESKFREMYPDKDFYDESGKPRIATYDINSMYPYVMHQGIPYGGILYTKPEGIEGIDYCVWYCVNFYDAIDRENQVIYDWRKKYQCFNNQFFSNQFVKGCGAFTNREYVLKELYQLFVSMNKHKTRVIRECYQRLDKTFVPKFIEPLYDAKANKEKYTEGQISVCKLMMNSLYGKMAEKFRTAKIVFSNDVKRAAMDYAVEVLLNHPKKDLYFAEKHYSKELFELEDIGFMRLENINKRFNDEGNEWRESIMSGMYITQKSRWLLLSSVKAEIDQGNIFLNCDTDSMKIVQINPVKIDVDKKRLGAWKDEGRYTHFGHPNMLKKYFLFDINSKATKASKWGKLASGGIPNSAIWPLDLTKEQLLDMWKTIFNVDNRVVIKNAKNTCSWTKRYHQPIITAVDIEFIGGMKKDVTHEVINQRLYGIK